MVAIEGGAQALRRTVLAALASSEDCTSTISTPCLPDDAPQRRLLGGRAADGQAALRLPVPEG